MELINVFDYETLAQTHLDPVIWDYLQGGSGDEVTLCANRSSFEHIRLRPRVLADVSSIDMRTTVLGTPVTMPLLVGPTASHSLIHPDGELATIQGAEQAEALMVVSGFASHTVEELAAVTHGPLWLQLYTHSSLRATGRLVQRAEAAGYRAIVLTVDSAEVGNRERDRRNNFKRSDKAQHANFSGEDALTDPHLQHFVDTWETVDWLRSITTLPIMLKGILTAEDAVLAIARGVEGIVVSNHGGRQLDGVLASIEALPEIAEAVAGRCEIYLDGGVRRGTDILKALALGARAVLIGRPILWGLAVNGATGVQHVLELLRAELELSMKLVGRPTLASIDHSLVKL